jgi:hypothetical protein
VHERVRHPNACKTKRLEGDADVVPVKYRDSRSGEQGLVGIRGLGGSSGAKQLTAGGAAEDLEHF